VPGRCRQSSHSASFLGSSRQCELSRAPVASFAKRRRKQHCVHPARRDCAARNSGEIVAARLLNTNLISSFGVSPSRFSIAQKRVSSPESGHFTSTILITSAGTRASGALRWSLIALCTRHQQPLHERHNSRSCSMGSPPVISTSPPRGLNRETSSNTASIAILRPALKRYTRCRTTSTADCIRQPHE